MQKLAMHSQDITQDNIERIAALFPHCVKEAKNEHGELVRMVDFDVLRQELSNSIVEGPQERYDLNWPGKRSAQLAANAPIAKTLRPCKEESVDFDSTKNLFIEGDNLDALKLLQKSYLGKVKMIYIDPPYNTGNDFIYKDNFRVNKQEYLLESEQIDEEGNRLVANTENNGLFHSDWLSMMYPRLKLARNLLRDDGVIFISIDDNEVHNLRKICDEVFGARNFVGLMTIQSNPRGSQASKHLSSVHEYIIMYTKKHSLLFLKGVAKSAENINEYSEVDKKGQKFRFLGLRQRGGAWKKDDRPLMHYPIYVNPENGTVSLTKSENFTIEVIPQRPTGELSRWTWGKEKFSLEKEKIIGKKVNRAGIDEAWDIFRRDYLYDENGEEKTAKIKTMWIEKEINYQNAKNEIKGLFANSEIFDFPKPTYIVKQLAAMLFSSDSDIILDFFSGSATTAHAVMQLNAEDGGNRQFIMVQWPEECAEKSEAFKAGYSTIAEISKERIRRAGAKIQAELKEKQQQEQKSQPSLLDSVNSTPQNSTLDIGFRVLKVDSSNMADVYYTPSDTKQDMLASLTGNIKTDRTAEDLLFQVLIDWGVEPTLPIREEIILEKKVFFVDENALVACFETGITNELAKELAASAPLRVLFRDNGFASDAVKINIEQIFTQLSPHTEVKCL